MLRLFRKIIRHFKRKGVRYTKQFIKKSLIAYAISILPVGYITTAIANPLAHFDQPIQTVKQWANGGVSNMLTLGLSQPLGELTDSVLTSVKGVIPDIDLGSWNKHKEEVNQTVEPSQYMGEARNWNFESYPNYYKVLGVSDIDVTTFPKTGVIQYDGLDELGRTKSVKGSLTFDNVSASYGVREQFTNEDNPSGWRVNDKARIEWLNGKSYNGYFWNRSHLLADSLGGEAKRENLITGTRTQNVGGTDQKGGMRYTEIKAKNWLESNTGGVLYYQADPLYDGDELIPRAVVVSVLSSDKEIDEKVLVFNTANGYSINYTDGSFGSGQ